VALSGKGASPDFLQMNARGAGSEWKARQTRRAHVSFAAKVLVIISPAGFEKFFEEIAGPPDLQKIMALAPKYNLQIVGPPPEQSEH
jgi:hypothetical protein